MSAFRPPGVRYRDPTSTARAATIALMLAAALQSAVGLVIVRRLVAGDTLTFWVSEQGTIVSSGAFRLFQWVSLLFSISVYVAWLTWQYQVHTMHDWRRLIAYRPAPVGVSSAGSFASSIS